MEATTNGQRAQLTSVSVRFGEEAWDGESFAIRYELSERCAAHLMPLTQGGVSVLEAHFGINKKKKKKRQKLRLATDASLKASYIYSLENYTEFLSLFAVIFYSHRVVSFNIATSLIAIFSINIPTQPCGFVHAPPACAVSSSQCRNSSVCSLLRVTGHALSNSRALTTWMAPSLNTSSLLIHFLLLLHKKRVPSLSYRL